MGGLGLTDWAWMMKGLDWAGLGAGKGAGKGWGGVGGVWGWGATGFRDYEVGGARN